MTSFAQGINTKTMALTDYRMINDSLMQVVVATTGHYSKDDFREALAAQFDNMAAGVENSFREIQANVHVGIVRANREVRVVDAHDIRASYQVVAKNSNILMSNEDESLWRIQEGTAGKYLTREGHEDLTALAASAHQPRQLVASLSNTTMAPTQSHEFVAFVSASGDMDYGFCAASSKDKTKLKVASVASSSAVVISQDQVIASFKVEIPNEAKHRLVTAGISRADADKSIEYYTELYSYDPAYLAKVIKDVESTMSA